MSSDRLIRIFAGSFILLSLALAHVYAQAVLALVYRVRRREPAAKRLHPFLSAGNHPLPAWGEEGGLSAPGTELIRSRPLPG